MMIKAIPRDKRNTGEFQPVCNPIVVDKQETKVEWELGMPPEPIKRRKLILW
jgi:hypothetical protein